LSLFTVLHPRLRRENEVGDRLNEAQVHEEDLVDEGPRA